MEVASTSDRAKSFGRFLESLGTGLLGNRLAGDRFRQRVCWGTCLLVDRFLEGLRINFERGTFLLVDPGQVMKRRGPLQVSAPPPPFTQSTTLLLSILPPCFFSL